MGPRFVHTRDFTYLSPGTPFNNKCLRFLAHGVQLVLLMARKCGLFLAGAVDIAVRHVMVNE